MIDDPPSAADLLEPPAEDASAEPAERSRFDRLRPWLAAAILIVASGNLIRVPYYSIGPGPATDVLDIVRVDGTEIYPSKGDLLLTTASISSRSLSFFEYLWVLVDPNLELIDSDLIVPPGTSDQQQDEENLRAMESSKLEAEHAAYAALGYRQISAVRILDVSTEGASNGLLEPGDLVLRFDGIRMRRPQQLVNAIGRRAPGDEVEVVVERDGEHVAVTITLGEIDGQPRLGVTLLPAYRPSLEVSIDTQRIGGPSGGLVFALALVELLDDEDLTRGRTIAVTGTISLQDGVGVVGPIGGVQEKIRGALEVGAEILLVPLENEQAALEAAPPELKVIGVGTLQDAIEALRAP